MQASQVQQFAEYNHWMNTRIMEVCSGLTDNERKQDRGAFFKSIHGTLEHILIGDRLWLGRFKGEPYDIKSLDQRLYEDFNELYQQRDVSDRDIIDWAKELNDEVLAEPFKFTTFVNPSSYQCSLWSAVTHFFNHQTHHRGQLTTLLSQLNVDVGVTDYLFLPGLLEDI